MLKQWCVVSLLIALMSCSDSKPSAASASREATGVRPVRVDTLRTEVGELYTASFFWLAVQRSGTVVAVDQDDKHLTRFDSLGRATRVAMRKGNGPGEAQYPTAIFLLPLDTVAVWDGTLRRMAIFDSTLNFARTEVFTNWNFISSDLEPVGRFADGRWVAKATSRYAPGIVRAGVTAAADTVSLVAGRSNEAPTTLMALSVRRGANVVLSSGGGFANHYIYRPNAFQLGRGVACDSGLVIVDESGVRTIDWHGVVTARAPLTMGADTLRTESDIERELKYIVWPPVDTSSYAPAVRRMIREVIGANPVRYESPMMDITGGVSFSADRKRSGIRQMVASDAQASTPARMQARMLRPPLFEPDSRIAGRIMTATTANLDDERFAIVSHFANPLTGPAPARFGGCSSAFTF